MKVKAAVARIEEARRGAATPSEAVRQVLKQIRKEKINLPDVDQQAKVREIRDGVYAAHVGGVQYSSEQKILPKADPEPADTRFVVDPSLGAAPGRAPPNDPVVLAVSRGILYGLARTSGKIRWAVHVGVDTTALPVRVPESEGVPERILAPSADAKALDALDGEGRRLWRYRMGAPCIGRPLVVGPVAYLASYDGNVHEIELAQGKLLGVYPLGQPLTVGGVRDPDSGLLYFPADAFCVYEIDPAQHKCTHVLYTGHPAGSLRGEPLIVSAPDESGVNAPWLVLSQAHGLGATRLRIYRLPFGDDREAPAALDPPPETPGWTWFPPSRNGEQLAMVGDTGVLGLFDIRQERNPKDPLLFPGLVGDLNLVPDGKAKARGRSEVVEAAGQDFWILAGGALRRFTLELNAADGPRMTEAAGWRKSAPDAFRAWASDVGVSALGSPLHASQAEPDPVHGRTMLVLATQALNRQISLATALDDQSGAVMWQRQLGLISPVDPLELRRPGGDGSLLLVLDQGGALFAFDPARQANLGDGEWRDAGQPLFGSMDDGPGAAADAAAQPRRTFRLRNRLAGRRPEPGDPPRRGDGERPDQGGTGPRFARAAGGMPAVTETMMILPLADGRIVRTALPLDRNSTIVNGPPWRSRRAPPDARARVTALGPDTFLTYDGARGLTHWKWPLTEEVAQVLPADKEPPTLAAKEGGSLTADPIVLPNAPGSPRRVCIADVSGDVTLLTVADDGALKSGRSWNVGGRITAGPYLQVVDGATRIGCVVDGKQATWIDPEKDDVLWTYAAKAGAALAGRPRLVGDMVVVADESGRIVGLKPETGEPAGFDYQVQGSAAPTAGAAGFGKERLFVPLTDGTVLLPKMERMH